MSSFVVLTVLLSVLVGLVGLVALMERTHRHDAGLPRATVCADGTTGPVRIRPDLSVVPQVPRWIGHRR